MFILECGERSRASISNGFLTHIARTSQIVQKKFQIYMNLSHVPGSSCDWHTGRSMHCVPAQVCMLPFPSDAGRVGWLMHVTFWLHSLHASFPFSCREGWVAHACDLLVAHCNVLCPGGWVCRHCMQPLCPGGWVCRHSMQP